MREEKSTSPPPVATPATEEKSDEAEVDHEDQSPPLSEVKEQPADCEQQTTGEGEQKAAGTTSKRASSDGEAEPEGKILS